MYPRHLRVQIQVQRWQGLTRGWSGWLEGGWVDGVSRYTLRVIILHGAAWESPRFHASGCFQWLISDPRHVVLLTGKMVSVRTIYFLILNYEMEKDSCYLPSCDSFIGWQLRKGQTLGSSGKWQWSGQMLDYQDSGQDDPFIKSRKWLHLLSLSFSKFKSGIVMSTCLLCACHEVKVKKK